MRRSSFHHVHGGKQARGKKGGGRRGREVEGKGEHMSQPEETHSSAGQCKRGPSKVGWPWEGKNAAHGRRHKMPFTHCHKKRGWNGKEGKVREERRGCMREERRNRHRKREKAEAQAREKKKVLLPHMQKQGRRLEHACRWK